MQQGFGGGIHSRAGACRKTDKLKTIKVEKSEAGWQRDLGHRLKRKQDDMVEGGRKER